MNVRVDQLSAIYERWDIGSGNEDRLLTSSPFAAVSLCNVLVNVAIGCGIGAGVLAARRYGEGSRPEATRVIWTSVALFTGIGLAIAIAGLPFAEAVLLALNTPADALADSYAYLSVYFVGLPALFALNALTAMFNAVGDSGTPLYLLINLGLRVGLAHLLAPTLGIAVIWWVVPLGWFVNFAISHAGVFAWRRAVGA